MPAMWWERTSRVRTWHSHGDPQVRGIKLPLDARPVGTACHLHRCRCRIVDGGGTMAERMHRTQILLEPEQHRTLTEIARSEGRSISDVVREMIRERLEHRKQALDADLKRQLEALE